MLEFSDMDFKNASTKILEAKAETTRKEVTVIRTNQMEVPLILIAETHAWRIESILE